MYPLYINAQNYRFERVSLHAALDSGFSDPRSSPGQTLRRVLGRQDTCMLSWRVPLYTQIQYKAWALENLMSGEPCNGLISKIILKYSSTSLSYKNLYCLFVFVFFLFLFLLACLFVCFFFLSDIFSHCSVTVQSLFFEMANSQSLPFC